jgi:hypothetical protein
MAIPRSLAVRSNQALSSAESEITVRTIVCLDIILL